MTWYRAGGRNYKIVPKTFDANGTYTAEDYNVDGFTPVTVDVPYHGIKIIPISFEFYELAT